MNCTGTCNSIILVYYGNLDSIYRMLFYCKFLFHPKLRNPLTVPPKVNAVYTNGISKYNR